LLDQANGAALDRKRRKSSAMHPGVLTQEETGLRRMGWLKISTCGEDGGFEVEAVDMKTPWAVSERKINAFRR
jgi:hypothetical protein